MAMGAYEYTVIPSPSRGEKTRAAKTPADRFAHALAQALNGMAAQGWEYVRAETLPAEERSGLTGRTTVWMNVLVFRRPLAAVATGAESASSSPEAAAASPASAAGLAADAEGESPPPAP